jgi:hypothetical protein
MIENRSKICDVPGGHMKILEIKRHLNKPDESYLCDLFTRGRDFVVLKYVNERSGKIGEVTIEAGSITHAYYKTGEGYVVWKLSGPEGTLTGHLFHICRELKVDERQVEYLDMLLDLWIDPHGRLTVLDQDEVDACAENGVLGERDLAWIADQKRGIIENMARIIGDFDLLLKTD